jgi:hypothetical protein
MVPESRIQAFNQRRGRIERAARAPEVSSSMGVLIGFFASS